ncbi:MAG: Ig-like domain-containing protein [Verrucomicrobiales bacterium]|nr:Ig-like domain-containing protein [Verrucomicrobiales bacterium]
MNAMVGLLNHAAAEYWVWLTHASWQVAVVGLLLWGVASLGAKWRAPWRYALLLIALIKFVVPPFFPVGSGVLSWVAVPGAGGREQVVTEVLVEKGILGSEGIHGTHGTKVGAATLISPSEGKREAEVVVVPRVVEREVVRTEPSSRVVRGAVSLQWPAWVLLVHLAGAVAVALWVLRQLSVVHGWVRQSQPVEDIRAIRLLEDLSRQLELRRVPDLRFSDQVPAPIAFGLWHRTILLPADSLARLPESEWRAVLGHELAHFRRGDLWVNWLQILLQAIWWFHPVLWLVNRALRQVREDCCDDLVLAQRVSTRERYGEVLVRAASVFSNPGAVAGTLGFGEDLHPLGRRLVRIMDPTIVRAPRLSMTGMAAAVVMAAFLLPGVRLESAGQAPLPASSKLAQAKDAELVPYQSGRPKLVAVAPGNGATEVPPDTRIRLRFDRPMDPGRMELEWKSGGFYSQGDPEYLEASHEFVLPVRLIPGKHHSLQINSASVMPDPKGFQSNDGVVAESATIEFTTAMAPARGTTPRVVKVDPPSGSKVGRLTVMRIEFDQSMDPDRFDGLLTSEPRRESGGPRPSPKPITLVEWDADRRVASMPVTLPQECTVDLSLRGFWSVSGATNEPVVVTYSTGSEIWSTKDVQHRREAAASPKLSGLVVSTQAARRSLKSLSERVRTIRWSGTLERPRNALSLRISSFKLQGERQFFADIRQIMEVPFSVGSDGEHCWFLMRETDAEKGDRLIVRKCSFDDVGEKNLSFAEPFASVEGLEYLGMGELGGHVCHRVRGWTTHEFSIGIEPDAKELLASARTWWIDAKDFRLRLLEEQSNYGGSQSWYLRDLENEPIPDSEFRPSAGQNVVVQPADPLAEGYTVRTLSVRDGSDGRMSVRWGMQGPPGATSSGLN